MSNSDDFCKGCTLCCTWPEDSWRPTLQDDEISNYQHELLEDGRYVPALKEGTRECYYLTPEGCSIHTFSPSYCQLFNCAVLPQQVDEGTLQYSLIIAQGFKRMMGVAKKPN